MTDLKQRVRAVTITLERVSFFFRLERSLRGVNPRLEGEVIGYAYRHLHALADMGADSFSVKRLLEQALASPIGLGHPTRSVGALCELVALKGAEPEC